jgi:aryl-alcohol dehydrogenase-like predicted oxidoreductase
MIMEQMGTLEVLAQLRREGLLRAFGISTKTVEGGLAAARCCDVVMLTYNTQQREALPVLDACASRGCGVLVKKAFGNGHLLAPAGTGSADAAPAPQIQRDPLQATMDLLLEHPGTGAAVVGTINPTHLQANVTAARLALERIARR